MAVQAIKVHVDLKGVPEVAAALTVFRDSLVNRVMKSGATKGARRTQGPVKANLRKHKRTGQLEKAVSVKYRGYPKGWVVMLGPRKAFAGNNTGWMSPNATRIDPVKYAHLVEGGRKEVRPDNRRSMPIFVRKLDLSKRFKAQAGIAAAKIPRRSAFKFGRTTFDPLKGKARKVPGGWLLFTTFARKAPAYPWLGKAAPQFATNIKSSVVSEVQTALPRLAAQATARGSNPYRV